MHSNDRALLAVLGMLISITVIVLVYHLLGEL